jgi:MFS family permease
VDHEGAVRRNARLLVAAHAVAQCAFPVLLVVGVPAAEDLTGHAWASGLLWAASFAAGALGAFTVGRWMDRVGRRRGLVLGYAAIAVSAGSAGLSILAGSYVLLLVSTVVFGVGTGAAALARGAVADMYPPERRGRALGVIVAAGALGAIAGPLLIPWVRDLASAVGADPQVLPFAIAVAGGLGAVAFASRLRPDPRDLAHVQEDAAGAPPQPARSRRELLAIPAFRGALIAVAVSQMAMVGVMGVTPNALEHLGHEEATPWVISGHIAGMYLFAPVIGFVLDRWGRRTGLLAGLAISATGALLAGSAGQAPGVGSGLFAIGLGWSATYVAVTAVISDVTRADERSGALGFADLLVLVCSAAAALAGGFILEFASYGALGVAAAVLVVVGALGVVAAKVPRGAPARV